LTDICPRECLIDTTTTIGLENNQSVQEPLFKLCRANVCRPNDFRPKDVERDKERNLVSNFSSPHLGFARFKKNVPSTQKSFSFYSFFGQQQGCCNLRQYERNLRYYRCNLRRNPHSIK
jgi:hypothetical protein